MANELSFLGACRKARTNSPCRTHNEAAIHKGFTYILFTVLNKNKDNRKVGDTPEENICFHALVNFESLLSGECKENVQNDIFRKNICTFLEKGIKTETTISSGFRMVLPKLTKKS